MTEDEWEGVCFLMEQAWAGEFDDRKRHAYRVFLDKFTPGELTAALNRLAESGSAFLPKVPEIVQAVRKATVVPPPAWPEAWKALRAAMKKRTEGEAFAFATGVHEYLGVFLRLEGWRELRLVPFYDEDWGFKRIDDLHKRWDEFCERANERSVTARASLGRRDGPRQVGSAVDLLGLTPPDLPALEPGLPRCPTCGEGYYESKSPGGTETWTCGHAIGK